MGRVNRLYQYVYAFFMKQIFGETFSEHPPQLTAEVYVLLEEFTANENDEATYEAMHDVYKTMEFTVRPLIQSLDEYLNRGVISKYDRLFLVVLFAASKSLKIDLEQEYSSIINRVFQQESSLKRLAGFGLHENVIGRLAEILQKLQGESKDNAQVLKL